MITVHEFIEKLERLNQMAILHIYDHHTGETVPPNTITVADNDDETPIEYHIYYKEEQA